MGVQVTSDVFSKTRINVFLPFEFSISSHFAPHARSALQTGLFF